MLPATEAIDFVYENWAQRFQSLAQLAEHFGTVEGVRDLVTGLNSDDPDFLNEFIKGLDIPDLDLPRRGIWVRGIIQAVVAPPKKLYELQCWLLDPMSAQQTQTYMSILVQFGYLTGALVNIKYPPIVDAIDSQGKTGRAVAPGQFQDALKNAGLLQCGRLGVTYVMGGASAPNPPEFVDFPFVRRPRL